MDDKLTDRQIETLAESCPWSYEETRDFVRVCESEGIPIRHIVQTLDTCADKSLPLPSPYIIAETLRVKGDK